MKQFILFSLIALIALPVLSQLPHPAIWRQHNALVGGSYPRGDTAHWYVQEIKERTKCDTIEVIGVCSATKPNEVDVCAALHFETIIICDDTTWAPKIQVWLTPDQVKKLMGILK